ncbi:putative membrane protein [Streptomyces davaonensis JCM 4913]|uniref:Putative membrane protein n=1 Tax=Streptomyces davaonensis (strain DSM 101723 / JCM 4913 / KCC S-0913 / 768) TaxID=1214101 RepID=K4QT66_STRDJ|nr:putative membrane protein [Streptomyces davaonensis JCM 4913]
MTPAPGPVTPGPAASRSATPGPATPGPVTPNPAALNPAALNPAVRRAGARRAPLLLAAGLCLLAGLDAALGMLGLPAPVTADRLPRVHGVLMVLGFAGTLVALERAVALGRPWGYAAPGCLGAGGLLLLSPVDLVVPRLLLAAGCAALVALYVRFWRRQASAALLAQAAGAVSALGAALLWLGGIDVPRMLPWLVAFLVLTIAGERLELARVAVLAPSAEPTFLASVGAVATGVVATLLWPATGRSSPSTAACSSVPATVLPGTV